MSNTPAVPTILVQIEHYPDKKAMKIVREEPSGARKETFFEADWVTDWFITFTRDHYADTLKEPFLIGGIKETAYVRAPIFLITTIRGPVAW